MSNRVVCQNCGGRVDVPAGFSRAKLRCPGCGYYAEVPPEMRSAPVEEPESGRGTGAGTGKPAAPEMTDDDYTAGYGFSESPAAPPPPKKKPRRAQEQTDPRDHRPRFDVEEGAGTPMLEGTRDEDDDKPYAVPGTGLRPCPHCQGELPLDATLCVHCGRDLATGSKATRSYQPINREWAEGWSLPTRLQLLGAAIVLDVLAFAALLFNGQVDVVGGFFGMMPQAALQAFLIGSFDTLAIKRTARGQTTVTRTRRFAFVALQPAKVKWKQSEGVGIIATHNPGVLGWMTCLYLALFCLVPAALFYWFVIRPERFDVALCDVYGSTDEVVFHSKDRDQAVDVARTLSESTGLVFKTVM